MTQGATDTLASGVRDFVFPRNLEPIPGMTEIYELELAWYESRLLPEDELIRNAAYFASVGGTPTRHVRICAGDPLKLPNFSSSRLRSFFNTKQFKTGYATHGLFPYRGKFHPQMVKALINVMGLKSGETVLDPMMGSGTVLVEASLMGIHSIGIDASPFCRLMAQAKIDGLTIPLDPIRKALKHRKAVLHRFGAKPSAKATPRANGRVSEAATPPTSLSTQPEPSTGDRVEGFVELAYLDTLGYAERSARQALDDQFEAVLNRYLFVVEKVQRALAEDPFELGRAHALVGDARALSIESGSIDGILFSPPYSFAVDYLENDAPHLNFLGVDRKKLRDSMVGLRGRSKAERLALYRLDIAAVLGECARVLRTGRFCGIVVGTNSNQVSRVTGEAPDAVQGFDELIVNLGRQVGLQLIRRIDRQITGMANTMRTESILILRRR